MPRGVVAERGGVAERGERCERGVPAAARFSALLLRRIICRRAASPTSSQAVVGLARRTLCALSEPSRCLGKGFVWLCPRGVASWLASALGRWKDGDLPKRIFSPGQ